MTPVEQANRRVILGRALMALAAAAAVVATVGSVSTVNGATETTIMVELWRLMGLAFFAGLFALLARRPGLHPGVWLLAIGNKALLAATGAAVLLRGGAPGAGDALLWDTLLTVLLISAFLLTRSTRTSDDSPSTDGREAY